MAEMPDWERLLHRRIVERNEREFCTVEHSYAHDEQIWRKFVALDNQRDTFKHSLSLLEYEISQLVLKGEPDSALDHCRKRLETLNRELLPVELIEQETKQVNLSKVIFDQRQLLKDQVDELMVAKSEMQRAMGEAATLSAQIIELQALLDKQKSTGSERTSESGIRPSLTDKT